MAVRVKRICKNVGIVIFVVAVSTVLLTYLFYRDFRKALASALSGRASAAIGQHVDIGDISISLSRGIDIDDLQVRNPDGFAMGRLLAVKKISLYPDYGAFLNGDIRFRKILISSPALTIVKDNQGRTNISAGLRRFFSQKKGKTPYRIDEIALSSGSIDIGGDPLARNEEISLALRDLSSEPAEKAFFQGTTLWEGGSRIRIEGWVYPGDEPKRFFLSLSAADLKFAPFREILPVRGIDPEKLKGDARLDVSGDTTEGAVVSCSLHIKVPGGGFSRGKALALGLVGDLEYRIPADSVELKDLAMKMDDKQVLGMKGTIREVTSVPSYDLTAKVEGLDLSAFDLMKGAAFTGLVSADDLRIRGKGIRELPAIEGALRVRKGSAGAKDFEVRDIDGRIGFSSAGEMSADMEGSAVVAKAAGNLLPKAAAVRFSLRARGHFRNPVLTASLASEPFLIGTEGGETISVGPFRMAAEGSVPGRSFSGRVSFGLTSIAYRDYRFRDLDGAVSVGYDGHALHLDRLKISADTFSLSAETLLARMPRPPKGFLLEGKGMSATYPSEGAEVKGATIKGEIHTSGGIDGRLDFTAIGASLLGTTAEGITGTSEFSGKSFSLGISHAAVGGGTIAFSAQGKTSGGPFPLSLEAAAEHVDAGKISPLMLKDKSGYSVSGEIEKAAFSGTADSADSVRGRFSVEMRRLTVADEKSNRALLKDASVRAGGDLGGKDLAFKTDISVGKVTAAVSGRAERFLSADRSARMQVHLAETPAAEIRNSFWDVFPDSLLYAGMEGSLSSDLAVGYGKDGAVVEGSLGLKGFTLTGENGEYSIGPVEGSIPVAYGTTGESSVSSEMPAFDRSDFERLKKRFGGEFREEGYGRLTVGSLRYGFRLLDHITAWLRPQKGVLEIGRFDANIFGGRLSGTGEVDLTGGLRYRAGVILDGMSLTRLCDEIEPIKGYISGMVDGVAMVKGSAAGIKGLIGKADFWTYRTKREETKISREFLRKVGGPSMKSYVGDRSFDKGEMSLYLQRGFVVFRDLEISNRNFFGMQDLSVKVAPLSNKISLEDLMWSMVQASERAGKKGE